jgi:hypothetical protein
MNRVAPSLIFGHPPRAERKLQLYAYKVAKDKRGRGVAAIRERGRPHPQWLIPVAQAASLGDFMKRQAASLPHGLHASASNGLRTRDAAFCMTCV